MKLSKTILSVSIVCAALHCASANVGSSFNSPASGTDGWTLNPADPASTLTYRLTGGVSGGYIVFSDGAQGAWDAFSAPLKFLGNDSMYYNGSLKFALRHNQSADGISSNPLTIVSTSGHRLTLALAAPAVNRWTSYTIPLNTTAGFRYDGRGKATARQIQAVLRQVSAIRIPADIHTGGETTGLDNVSLNRPSNRVAMSEIASPMRQWDFNGDGATDRVFMDDNTRLVNVVLSGSQGSRTVPIAGGAVPASFVLAGVADMNGDGTPDLVFSNPLTGSTLFWILSPASLAVAESKAGPMLPAGAAICGLEDFNSDGQVDLLIWNSAAQRSTVYLLNPANNTAVLTVVDGPAQR